MQGFPIREVVRYVAADLTALQAAALSGLNRNTVNRLYRGVMLLACEAQRRLVGVVEVDESFFGARRVKGRRGRGAYGKTVVFGIFAAGPRLYRDRRSKPTLQGIIRGRVDPRTVSTPMAGAATTNGHVRIMPATSLPFISTASKASGAWAKVRLTQFKGLPKHTFHLHLKETEWRYNHRHADKYKCLLHYLRKNPLS